MVSELLAKDFSPRMQIDATRWKLRTIGSEKGIRSERNYLKNMLGGCLGLGVALTC